MQQAPLLRFSSELCRFFCDSGFWGGGIGGHSAGSEVTIAPESSPSRPLVPTLHNTDREGGGGVAYVTYFQAGPYIFIHTQSISTSCPLKECLSVRPRSQQQNERYRWSWTEKEQTVIGSRWHERLSAWKYAAGGAAEITRVHLCHEAAQTQTSDFLWSDARCKFKTSATVRHGKTFHVPGRARGQVLVPWMLA